MRIYLTEECVHMYTTVRTRCSSLILAVVLSSFFTGAWAQETQEQLNEPILVVNDHVVKRGEFEDFYNFRRRPSSYHDNPLPAELEAARLEALRDLVNRLVLLDEANRRDLKADAEVVENNVQKAGQRYRDNPVGRKIKMPCWYQCASNLKMATSSVNSKLLSAMLLIQQSRHC